MDPSATEASGKLHAVKQQARLLAWGVDSAAPALLCALCCALAVAARSTGSTSQVTPPPSRLDRIAFCSAHTRDDRKHAGEHICDACVCISVPMLLFLLSRCNMLVVQSSPLSSPISSEDRLGHHRGTTFTEGLWEPAAGVMTWPMCCSRMARRKSGGRQRCSTFLAGCCATAAAAARSRWPPAAFPPRLHPRPRPPTVHPQTFQPPPIPSCRLWLLCEEPDCLVDEASGQHHGAGGQPVPSRLHACDWWSLNLKP